MTDNNSLSLFILYLLIVILIFKLIFILILICNAEYWVVELVTKDYQDSTIRPQCKVVLKDGILLNCFCSTSNKMIVYNRNCTREKKLTTIPNYPNYPKLSQLS